MALNFLVIDTTMTPLWDFGWFDLTRFKVDGPATEQRDCGHVLSEFLRDPLAQRSFCDPGQWGEPVQRHGPFRARSTCGRVISPDPHRTVRGSVRVALDAFDAPPDVEQLEPIEQWAAAVTARGDDVYALDASDEAEPTVEWDFVWIVYCEFASVSPGRCELAIGVIGHE